MGSARQRRMAARRSDRRVWLPTRYALPGCVFVRRAYFALQRGALQDPHRTGPDKLDCPSLLQMRQRTAHGLDREPEIIGDVVARHGEDEALAGPARHAGRHFEQIAADLLERRDAAHYGELRL